MKVAPNAQTNFERMLAYTLLPCGHLAIKIHYMTSSIIDFYDYLIMLTSYSR